MQFLIYSSLSLRRIGYSAEKPKKYQCEVNSRQNTQVIAPSSRLSHSRVLPSCCVNSLKVNLRKRTGEQTRLPLRGSSLVGTRDEPLPKNVCVGGYKEDGKTYETIVKIILFDKKNRLKLDLPLNRSFFKRSKNIDI